MKNQHDEKEILLDDSDDGKLPTALSTLSEESIHALYHQAKQIMGKMVDYKELRTLYACALKTVRTKLEILCAEFDMQYHRNPINAIQTRLKTTSSIVSKLVKLRKTIDIDSVQDNIHDIAGIRVICSYIDDVFEIADALIKQDDVTLITKKDYITSPKENGYRSLHLIVKVPVYLSERKLEMEVEVQIRTIAMDFWATLEHQLHYKSDFEGKESLVEELCACAETIHKTDREMMRIRTQIEALSDAPTEDEILIKKLRKIDAPIK